MAPSVKADPPKRARTPLASDSRCFAVMYAKPQTKKNKTWEDDGYLFLTKNNTLILRNMQVCANYRKLNSLKYLSIVHIHDCLLTQPLRCELLVALF